ncbi:type II secretion system F family protein [Blastopirellula marina]|nr:type II secretion system F family protein [Blastopirellula marina]
MAVILGVVLLILSTQWDSTTHEEPTVMRRALRLMAWMFICIGGTAWWIGVSGVMAVVMVLVIGIIVFGFAMQRYRVAENRSLVSVILAGLEKGISPITSIVAYRQEASGLQEQKAGRFARALGAGMPLGAAAKAARVIMPAEALMTLELGKTLGNVDEVNRYAKQFTRDETTNYGNFDFFLGALITIIVIGMFQVACLTFMEIKLMPTMSQLLEDFEIYDETVSTVWGWSSWSAIFILVGLYTGIPIAGFLAFLMILVQIGWLTELPWGLRWVHGPVNECRLLNVLSVVVAADLPLQRALDVIRKQFPSSRIRYIAHAIYIQMKNGGDWVDSIRSTRVVTVGEAALIRSAQEAGNLGWALKEVSVGKRRRHLHRMAPIAKVVLPIIVLISAFPVISAALGMFIPLVNMITKLSLV